MTRTLLLQIQSAERTLEEVCLTGNFERKLLGTDYCGLPNTARVRCGFKADEQDHNGLYICGKNLWLNEVANQLERNERDDQENQGKEGTLYT